MANTTTAKKKTTARKAPARKTTARKSAPRKAPAAKKAEVSVKQTAEKALNVYLGIIGKSIDAIQENLDNARKENDKRVKELEKRGAKLRKELTKRFEKIETPDFDEVVDDAKGQFNKLQDQIEDAVDSVKERISKAA
jgi:predicted nuclease with TOPRIM domain